MRNRRTPIEDLRKLHPSADPEVAAYGANLAEIFEDARRITSMPDGIVEFAGKDHRLHEEMDWSTGRGVKTGRLYAYCVVKPAGAASAVREAVKGVEYYSLEDITQALRDMNHYGAENIVAGIRKQLATRDDGRYTLDELKRAAEQTEHYVTAKYREDQLDRAALQARKNRVWEANGGT